VSQACQLLVAVVGQEKKSRVYLNCAENFNNSDLGARTSVRAGKTADGLNNDAHDVLITLRLAVSFSP
jgi:hypothetical protein